jgi:hypothetical protein
MNNLRDTITQLTAHITYPSESDEPIKYLEIDLKANSVWPPSSPEDFGKLFGIAATTMKITSFDPQAFFERWRLTFEAPLDRISALQQVLTKSLSELRGYRMGEVEVEIYLLGLDAEGHLCGIQTMSVET